MKIKVPELKVDLEEMDGIFEILTVSIACGKTEQILKELEAHWDSHLSKEWSCMLGTDSTYFMLYNLGEKLGIVYL